MCRVAGYSTAQGLLVRRDRASLVTGAQGRRAKAQHGVVGGKGCSMTCSGVIAVVGNYGSDLSLE
jgi:hypothetical protein